MSRNGTVSLKWGDGEHTFRLRIEELLELQEKCDAGPFFIMDRLHSRQCTVQDIRETIRLGLIGADPKGEAGPNGKAGMSPVKAMNLVKRYVDNRPLEESRLTAFLIIAGAIVGVDDEQLGKSQEDEETANLPYQEVNSDSLPSTGLEP